MGDTEPDLHTIVRAEVARMTAAVASAAPDASIAMSAAQFRKLADLLDHLDKRIELLEAVEGEQFGDPRYWVPLPVYERLRAAHDRASWLASSDARAFLHDSGLR